MSKLSMIDFKSAQQLSPISEQVYCATKEAILSGKLRAGDSFTDSALAEELSISRTPAREGLLRLAREGFLDSVSRKGFVVRNIRLEEANELYCVAIALEPYAAGAAARNRSQLNVDKLAAIMAKMQDGAEDEAKLHFQFHIQVAYAAGNKLLFEYVKQVREKMQILQTFQSAIHDQLSAELHSADEHRSIFEAIVARDCEVAELLMRRHLLKAQEHFLSSTITAE